VESVVALLNTVHEADWAIFMRESAWAFPVEHALTKLTHDILPWTWGAFGLVVLSGVAMFVSQPALYFENTAFRIKALVLLLAGCNMLYFHLVTFRDVDNWDKSKSTPLAAKFAGGASLTFWVAIILLGRQVGFTMY
jgi:hypothetical protein